MIILLNGTSSAGKTTLARTLQECYEGILLLYGVDNMVQGAFPEKCDFEPWNEQAIKVEMTEFNGIPHASLRVSSFMYPIYRSAVRFYQILSQQGYHLIVDEVLFDPHRTAPYFELLVGEQVYFIGVKPDKTVAIARERERGDRLPGLAAGLYDEVYNPLFQHDIELDTGVLTPEESAAVIIRYLAQEQYPQGFKISAARWHATMLDEVQNGPDQS